MPLSAAERALVEPAANRQKMSGIENPEICRAEVQQVRCPVGQVPIFHGTSAENADQIFERGMRFGDGLEGEGAYFTMRVQALSGGWRRPGDVGTESGTTWSKEWATRFPEGRLLVTCIPANLIQTTPEIIRKSGIPFAPLSQKSSYQAHSMGVWGDFPSSFSQYYRSTRNELSLDEAYAEYRELQENARQDMLEGGTKVYFAGDELVVYDPEVLASLQFREVEGCRTTAGGRPVRPITAEDPYEVVEVPITNNEDITPQIAPDRHTVLLPAGEAPDGSFVFTNELCQRRSTENKYVCYFPEMDPVNDTLRRITPLMSGSYRPLASNAEIELPSTRPRGRAQFVPFEAIGRNDTGSPFYLGRVPNKPHTMIISQENILSVQSDGIWTNSPARPLQEYNYSMLKHLFPDLEATPFVPPSS